jgi:chromosome partitioning protein
MSIYALWNNKGGVGKSYLTFQIAAEYARTHAEENILVIDLCPQANSSSMLLGGMVRGEAALDELGSANPRRTLAGYIRERITSPYVNPQVGANYLTHVRPRNNSIPNNLYLVVGDGELEILGSRVFGATRPGPTDAWNIVHRWINDLINDARQRWNVDNLTVFIDCNPSFSIYTELALAAAQRLIIPFSADGSSRRAVRTVLNLLYGDIRQPGAERSEFARNMEAAGRQLPEIYCYVGNRLTQANRGSATAFRTVVNAIGDEIWAMWQTNPGAFCVHPSGTPSPVNRNSFRQMFQFEVVDANTASVVSGALGIPIVELTSGVHVISGRNHTVNQSQLDRQQPNIQDLVATIE